MTKNLALLGLFLLTALPLSSPAHAGQTGQAAHFTAGTTRTLAQKTMGPSGGSLTIQGTQSPLDGVVLTVPPGALERNVLVSVGSNDGVLSLRAGTPAGVALVLSFGGATSLAQPAALTIPLDPQQQGAVPMAYAIDDQGRLDPLMLAHLDRGRAATFHSFRPVTLTWVYGR